MSGTRSDVWYRNPLVWMMIALPAWSVIAGISTVVVAFQVFDGVVVDDYYAQGKAINLVLERDIAAEQRGLTAVATVVPPADESGGPAATAGSAIEIAISALDLAHLPEELALALLHSTRGGLDVHVALHRTSLGRYRGALPPLAPGKYYLQIEAADWRIVGTLRRPADSTTSLGPAR